MVEKRVQRRLAAILAADVVGYSRLMSNDESGTLARLKALRSEVFDPTTEQFGGRIFKTTGDGAFVEFGSAVEAVQCSIEIQRELAQRNGGVSEDQRMALRIGISLGDVIVDGDDLYGNGVNVAARMEGLAEHGGICVSSNVQEHIGNTLDVSLEDLGDQAVKNIDRPIRCYRVLLRPNRIAEPSEYPPLPDKPSIAVLPFENMSGDSEQEYFSDGIAEDIITALSRFSWFFVIARNSSFSYKGQSLDIRHVAEDLSVRYVLEGSVRKAGSRVRITVQLIDTTTGAHIWADRYDRELEDIFAVQDEITETVVTAIEPELSRAEQMRARRKRTDDLNAWDCYQRGVWHLWRASKDDNEQAQKYFLQATKIDPHFASGFSGQAASILRTIILGLADQPETALVEGLRAANTALSLDERDAVAHYALCMAANFTRDYAMCRDSATKAIDINPNYAMAYLARGISLAHAGQGEDSLPDFDEFERLSPRDPMLWLSLTGRAIAYLRIYDNETANFWTQKAIQSPNALIVTHVYHIIALTRLDRIEEARIAASEALRNRPDFSLAAAKTLAATVDPKLTKNYMDDLRKAGVPI